MKFTSALLFACAFAPSFAQGPSAAIAPLIIAGDIDHPLSLSTADLAKMTRTSVTIDSEGTASKYEGVLLYDVLKQAGAPLDKQLSGKALASYFLAEARDGYQVAYTLAELDPNFGNNKILIADTLNGKPLFDYQGPMRLVVPGDKKGARSIRMLSKITVVRLRK